MDEIGGEVSSESFPFEEVSWKVQNFFELPTKDSYYLQSPEFTFADATWCLRLFPNGNVEDNSIGNIDILLVRLRSSSPEHWVWYKLGFKTRCGEEYVGCEWDTRFVPEELVGGIIFYLERSEFLDESNLLVLDGAVTVFCHMRLLEKPSIETSLPTVEEVSSTSSGSPSREESTSVKKLQQDYKKLLDRGEESDVSLVVSDREFRAHKCILKVRSPVFGAMFNHETEEKSSGKVVIDDLDPDCFQEFLEHLYTGRVEVLSDENAFGLYTAADKYDAQALKSECREYMQRTLSVDNFCDVMALALRYQETELMEQAVDFFAKNLTEVIVTVKWQIFLRENSTQANELFIKALVPRKKE